MSFRTSHDEAGRHELHVAVGALVAFAKREIAVGGQPPATGAGVPPGKSNYRDVPALFVARGRGDETPNAKFALEAGLVQVQLRVPPPIESSDHKCLVADRNDRPDPVGRDELRPSHRAFDDRHQLILAR
jgi:hypothetical protein